MVEVVLPSGHITHVSEEDYERVSQHKWHLHPRVRGGPYVIAHKINGKRTLLHRFIMGVTDPNLHVDHRDSDGLNNRRPNIRSASQSNNNKNKSPHTSLGQASAYKCVDRPYHTKWRARITVDRKSIHLGMFDTEAEAAHAYDVAALNYFGEFAKLNLQESL